GIPVVTVARGSGRLLLAIQRRSDPLAATIPRMSGAILRVATYNIHKGVQGLGPARRLEIHNLGHAVEQLDADIVCLQEVRKLHRREERYFKQWPELPQAEFLA